MSFPTIEEFESGEFDVAAFGHEAHVYVAWSYLRETDLLDAIARYRSALRQLTRRLGAEGKYHETITWFYLVAIAERQASDPVADWPTFKRANPDLLAVGGQWLCSYYSPKRLASMQARSSFLLPDRVPRITRTQPVAGA